MIWTDLIKTFGSDDDDKCNEDESNDDDDDQDDHCDLEMMSIMINNDDDEDYEDSVSVLDRYSSITLILFLFAGI